MEKLTDNLKKVILAGIGAVLQLQRRSKDVLDDMVKKGELTVEQGKVLNEELKHNLKQTVKNNVNVKVKVTTGRVERTSRQDNARTVQSTEGSDQGERVNRRFGSRRGRCRRYSGRC